MATKATKSRNKNHSNNFNVMTSILFANSTFISKFKCYKMSMLTSCKPIVQNMTHRMLRWNRLRF